MEEHSSPADSRTIRENIGRNGGFFCDGNFIPGKHAEENNPNHQRCQNLRRAPGETDTSKRQTDVGEGDRGDDDGVSSATPVFQSLIHTVTVIHVGSSRPVYTLEFALHRSWRPVDPKVDQDESERHTRERQVEDWRCGGEKVKSE